MEKLPFEIYNVDASVWYKDENGESAFFSVKTTSIDSLVEGLGKVERKVQTLKQLYESTNANGTVSI